jgi:hypothetical protein
MRMARLLSPRMLQFAASVWPPYLGAGIRVRHVAHDYRSVTVEVPLRWYNRNFVGTQFGGSLYAMADPFFMLMLVHVLGRDYQVWDKTGSIDYVAPGRGRVWARFELADDDLAQIRHMTATGDKHLHLFKVDIKDDDGLVVARIEKIVYIRRRRGAEEGT